MVRTPLFRAAEVLLPSLGAAAFCSRGFQLAGLANPEFWVLLTGVITLAVYLFYYSWPFDNPKPTSTPMEKWGVGLAVFFLGLGVCWLSLLSPQVWLLYGFSSILPILYLNPKLWPSQTRFSQWLLSHKPLFLAIVWIWGAFLLPWFGAGNAWQTVPWCALLPCWVNLFALCTLFSWRDSHLESQANWLKRLFQHPRWLISLFACCFCLSAIFSPDFPLMELVQAMVLLACCFLANRQHRLAYVIADASMLLWWW